MPFWAFLAILCVYATSGNTVRRWGHNKAADHTSRYYSIVSNNTEKGAVLCPDQAGRLCSIGPIQLRVLGLEH